MIALPVVNNTYLMESNTDNCKLFNCLLIPQEKRKGVGEIIYSIKYPPSH